MAETSTLRRSPLSHLHDRMSTAAVTGDRAVSVTETPFLTQVSLRVEPGTAAADRLEAVLGGALPDGVGRTMTAGTLGVAWLGPDELLVVAQADPEPLTAALSEALGTDRGAVVDVSANRTVVELSGPGARSVLEKGCPVDLHPRAFGPGVALTTTLGPVPLLLWQTAPTTYRLLPRTSFADYVARWLMDAMTELGSPEVP
jgi:sarcosine oxidase, subunit gamma